MPAAVSVYVSTHMPAALLRAASQPPQVAALVEAARVLAAVSVDIAATHMLPAVLWARSHPAQVSAEGAAVGVAAGVPVYIAATMLPTKPPC